MLWAIVVLFLALVAASAVLLYMVYPYRGEPMPRVPRVGEVMKSVVDRIPTVHEEQVRHASRH